VMDNESELKYLSAPVRRNLETNKSMREGFVNTCRHIARCLENKRIPSEDNVLFLHRFETSEWPPVTKNYLQRGGTVAAVAVMLFATAMSQDWWSGDGQHQYCFGDDIKELPECRNDHEFGFVSGMCGFKRISTVNDVDMMVQPIDYD
jgi:hypothetical protein